MIAETENKPPRPGLAMGWRFGVACVLLVVLAAAATATAGLEKVSKVTDELFPKSSRVVVPANTFVTPSYDGAPETYLILGSDRRAQSKDAFDRDDPAHSDTILLVRFDPAEGETSVLSIPRDLLVHIDYDGQDYYPEKANAAYTIGSEHGLNSAIVLATKTVEQILPGIKLDGVMDVSFAGFIDVVDDLGCVYVNVDHRYYNDNVGTPETNYADINLQPGYQKLCYTNALSYVRYREDDSDFVRVARQHDFLRDLRDDISLSDVTGQIDQIATQLGDSIQSSIQPSAAETIRLIKLITFSQRKPLRQVPFLYATDNTYIDGPDGGSVYVTTTSQMIRQTENDFLYGNRAPAITHKASRAAAIAAAGAAPVRHSTPASRAAAMARIDLDATPSYQQQDVVTQASGVAFPVLYPTLETGPAVQVQFRPYTVYDPSDHPHSSYVIVFQQNTQGGYYDVEGTNWLDPPLVAHPDAVETIDGRRYMLIDDGAHIHVIAWRQDGTLYYVVNTLLEDLTNAQMIAIAQSMAPLG